MIVVVVLPFTQFFVEQVDAVGDSVLIEHLVEPLLIYPVWSLDFAVELR